MNTLFQLRPYTPSDAQAVVAVVNADAAATMGVRRALVDDVGQVRLARYVPAACDKVVAVDPAGQVAGYAYLADREQHIVYELGGAVHPDRWGQGIGAALLSWAGQRATLLSQRAPAGVKTVLQGNLFAAETRAGRLFARFGYAQAREWLHLQIDLAAPPPTPIIPDGMRLAAIDLDDDWDLLGPAMEDAFADHWGVIPPAEADTADDAVTPDEVEAPDEELPEDESYSNTPGFCFKLLAGDEVAGGVLCNAKLVEQPEAGRVGSLFVRPQFRRLGAGRALMLAAFQAFWQHDIRRIIADTDAGSFTQAPKLYTSLGMRPYRQEFLVEKEIRPGRELRRLHL
jgi:mycothiol synthase